MRKQIKEAINIPEGVSCNYERNFFICSNNSTELKKEINLPQIDLKVEGRQISLFCKKGNKSHQKKIMSTLAHIKNMFLGLEKNFIYKLETCNLHFPITVKVEGDQLVINNFLGEKVPRYAKILPNSKVEIKGASITVSSSDRETAGQTAANFESATKVRKKDRRIYQDGIYIVEKPGRQNV